MSISENLRRRLRIKTVRHPDGHNIYFVHDKDNCYGEWEFKDRAEQAIAEPWRLQEPYLMPPLKPGSPWPVLG